MVSFWYRQCLFVEYLNRETEHRVSDGTRDGDRERERERQRERERERREGEREH